MLDCIDIWNKFLGSRILELLVTDKDSTFLTPTVYLNFCSKIWIGYFIGHTLVQKTGTHTKIALISWRQTSACSYFFSSYNLLNFFVKFASKERERKATKIKNWLPARISTFFASGIESLFGLLEVKNSFFRAQEKRMYIFLEYQAVFMGSLTLTLFGLTLFSGLA